MTSNEAYALAGHWERLMQEAQRDMGSLDVGTDEWHDKRCWGRECAARADVWYDVARRLEGVAA